MVQSLAVFVAEIQGEGLVRTGDPDYALLHQAARTIDRLLESLFRVVLEKPSAGEGPNPTTHASPPSNAENLLPWNLAASGDLLGYELDFWNMLGEHPSLLTPDATQWAWLGSTDANDAPSQ